MNLRKHRELDPLPSQPGANVERKNVAALARELGQQHRTVEAATGEHRDPRADRLDGEFFQARSRFQSASEARIALTIARLSECPVFDAVMWPSSGRPSR